IAGSAVQETLASIAAVARCLKPQHRPAHAVIAAKAEPPTCAQCATPEDLATRTPEKTSLSSHLRSSPYAAALTRIPLSAAQVDQAADAQDDGNFNLGLGEANQECAHQRGYRSRCAQGRDHASRVRPGVNLQSGDAGHQIEQRIDDSAPGVFENGSGQPEKPQ